MLSPAKGADISYHEEPLQAQELWQKKNLPEWDMHSPPALGGSEIQVPIRYIRLCSQTHVANPPKMFQSLATTCLWLAAGAAAQCSRALLQNATEQYVAAQTRGSLGALAYLARNATYTENGQRADISRGILSQAVAADRARSVHDTGRCATFTELIAATGTAHPYVIGTRMVLAGGRVASVESVVTDAGDWLFNATGYLHWSAGEAWDPIPAAERDSREAIQAAGDAYFDRFGDESVSVPFGTPCARLEGGAYTDADGTGGNTCSLGLPSTITVTNRRYVVDEEMGVVDIYVGFPGLDMSVPDQAMPDSHMFRVEKGEIRYVHTVSACVNAGCGLNGTLPPLRQRQRQHQQSVRRVPKLY
ncbi:hypothetical protein F4775DRAFT_603423 [Biscogniauxia sp. FL1348]|nr:hypothetical protein F4775DRAFT_603423 [Biscogniauxia sp. FL1348]